MGSELLVAGCCEAVDVDTGIEVAGLPSRSSTPMRCLCRFGVVRFRGETYTLVKRKHERGLTIGFVLW
jgi:hypothetical protein